MSGEGAEDPENMDADEIERIFRKCDARKQERYLRTLAEQNELAIHLVRCGFYPDELEMMFDEDTMDVWVYVKGPKGKQ